MSDLKSFAYRARNKNAKLRADILRKFGREEDGSIIVLTILLLIIMLVLGGMAVDFMRFESRRAALQSVADRSVLAAAELDQTLDSKQVVIDFFEKAGFEGSIVGEPRVSGNSQDRTVAVDASLDINTFYLRFIGIDELTAPATSTAVEGSGNVEIALVLDITGSMGEKANDAGDTRLDLLQDAATTFVTDVLKPEYDGKISISLVTYSEHVSLGDEIFAAIPTTPMSMFDTSQWRAGLIDQNDPDALTFDELPDPTPDMQIIIDDTPYNGPDEDDRDENIDPGTVPLYTGYTNPSRCVDMPDEEFKFTTFNTDIVYEQVENYDPTGNSNVPRPIRPICPENDYEAIIPLSKTPSVLIDAINDLKPRTRTSIDAGMKWGVTMLDPSFRPILENVASVDPAFAGKRPAEYSENSNEELTTKYLILMTDGNNVAGYRLEREGRDGREPAYENVLQRSYWANSNYRWWAKSVENRGPFPTENFEFLNDSLAIKNDLLQDICNAARGEDVNDDDFKNDKIIVWTIAMDAPDDGEQQMRLCASSPAHYKETSAGAVGSVLKTIASQLTDLRLSN